MPATLQTPSPDKCHSFVSKQSAEKGELPRRIPRPPNAFMLYRSDFLKKQKIPLDVEKRQQNLSRIAGQCWNMLPASEKAIWFGKADVVREEHRAKYPAYKGNQGTKRPPGKNNRRGPGHSHGQARARHTRGTPYCEGMFAALRDSIPLSPESQASLISATPSLSTSISFSPPPLPHGFLPSTFRTDFGQSTPPSTPDSSPDKRVDSDYRLVSLGSEMPQWGIPHVICNLENAPEQYRNDLPYTPYPSLSELPSLVDDTLFQTFLFSGSGLFPSARANLAGCNPLASDFNVTDALTYRNQSSVALYP